MTVERAALTIARQFDELSNALHLRTLAQPTSGAPPAAEAASAVEVALQGVVELAEATIPGCDWACITEVPDSDKPPRTRASTGPTAVQFDTLQYSFGEGPCLDAATTRQPVISPDLAVETRWPSFVAAAMRETPVRAVVSFDIGSALTRPSVKLAPHSSLNVYGRNGGALDGEAAEVAAVFAAQTRMLLRHLDSAHKAANLNEALTSSRIIGAAVGVIMSADKVTADQAFERLHRASARLHRKLRDIAQEVTEIGRLPDGAIAHLDDPADAGKVAPRRRVRQS